ncbi:ESX-1 secretion-associated protein [Mycobacterium sp. NPDC003323]
MAANLRVDPVQMAAAAAAESDTGSFIAGTAAGECLCVAADGVAQLLSGAAIRSVAMAVDQVTATVHEELLAHAENLTAAADTYCAADESLGRRAAGAVR